jgi:hypothetical protein
VAAVDEAYDRVFAMVAEGDYEVVHSHGFDPAALRHGRAGRARVIHTIHLPPEPEAAAALHEARRSDEPPVVVGVSAAQARAWASFARFDRVIRIGVPVERIPWSLRAGRGLVFAGRFSPDKGAAEAIEIARLADEPIDLYGSAYDAAYARDLHARYDGDRASRSTSHCPGRPCGAASPAPVPCCVPATPTSRSVSSQPRRRPPAPRSLPSPAAPSSTSCRTA